MGKVIAFRSSAKRIRPGHAPAPPGDAQILFFLGVRYSRMENPPNTTDAPYESGGDTTRGKKRKHRA